MSEREEKEKYSEGFPEQWKGEQKVNGFKEFFVPDNPKEYFIHHTYGENGQRKMLVSREDLIGVPMMARDYCAHIYIPYFDCLQKAGVLYSHACHHEWVDYERCRHEERRRNRARDVQWRKLSIELEVEEQFLREKERQKGR